MLKKIIKKIILFGILSIFISGLLIVIANYFVEKKSEGKIFSEVEQVEVNDVGLLLGTAKYMYDGRENLYYTYRIDAAVALFEAGKISYILVSGDNGRKEYDEPSSMKEDLIARGVPEEKIYLDYAGFRTLDSVVRSKEIFGQEIITVISQEFHNKRAIYIAQSKGIEAIGFNAKDVNIYYLVNINIREKLARVKMIGDLMFGKDPKFLGEKIEIGGKE
ncbi:MAG: DUF218 domain-containing protein [Candidatus Magasanikbacteria bacterium]|jgi:SanA protein|nr:DUF218 domain-containing protein [Candidatus Magasanikbacteria bacterium]MBT4071663.1 DUF218 domain-containing protein [Candidatus Magasanikbacteria bacterium]